MRLAVFVWRVVLEAVGKCTKDFRSGVGQVLNQGDVDWVSWTWREWLGYLTTPPCIDFLEERVSFGDQSLNLMPSGKASRTLLNMSRNTFLHNHVFVQTADVGQGRQLSRKVLLSVRFIIQSSQLGDLKDVRRKRY